MSTKICITPTPRQPLPHGNPLPVRETSLCPMEDKILESQLKKIFSQVEGFIGDVKIDSLVAFIKMMIESLEVNDYHLHEIISAIDIYTIQKYDSSDTRKRLGLSLENAAMEAKKLHESTQSA